MEKKKKIAEHVSECHSKMENKRKPNAQMVKRKTHNYPRKNTDSYESPSVSQLKIKSRTKSSVELNPFQLSEEVIQDLKFASANERKSITISKPAQQNKSPIEKKSLTQNSPPKISKLSVLNEKISASLAGELGSIAETPESSLDKSLNETSSPTNLNFPDRKKATKFQKRPPTLKKSPLRKTNTFFLNKLIKVPFLKKDLIVGSVRNLLELKPQQSEDSSVRKKSYHFPNLIKSTSTQNSPKGSPSTPSFDFFKDRKIYYKGDYNQNHNLEEIQPSKVEENDIKIQIIHENELQIPIFTPHYPPKKIVSTQNQIQNTFKEIELQLSDVSFNAKLSSSSYQSEEQEQENEENNENEENEENSSFCDRKGSVEYVKNRVTELERSEKEDEGECEWEYCEERKAYSENDTELFSGGEKEEAQLKLHRKLSNIYEYITQDKLKQQEKGEEQQNVYLEEEEEAEECEIKKIRRAQSVSLLFLFIIYIAILDFILCSRGNRHWP